MSKQQPFNRAEHCRRIAASGGRATVARHGSSHMAAIGVRGFRATSKHFRSTAEYKMYLARIGGWSYASAIQAPGWQLKFGEKPLAPWDEGFTEF